MLCPITRFAEGVLSCMLCAPTSILGGRFLRPGTFLMHPGGGPLLSLLQNSEESFEARARVTASGLRRGGRNGDRHY
eukprot:6194548-Pleurochrysis_carterae.AAC.1